MNNIEVKSEIVNKLHKIIIQWRKNDVTEKAAQKVVSNSLWNSLWMDGWTRHIKELRQLMYKSYTNSHTMFNWAMDKWFVSSHTSEKWKWCLSFIVNTSNFIKVKKIGFMTKPEFSEVFSIVCTRSSEICLIYYSSTKLIPHISKDIASRSHCVHFVEKIWFITDWCHTTVLQSWVMQVWVWCHVSVPLPVGLIPHRITWHFLTHVWSLNEDGSEQQSGTACDHCG